MQALIFKPGLKPDTRWDFAEIVVMMPGGVNPKPALMNRIVAFLAWRFPDDDIEVMPGRMNTSRDFAVIPMAGLLGPGGKVTPLDKPPAVKLREIGEALEEFRAAGWKRRLN